MGISKVDYNGETLIDISGDTVTPDTLAEGATAHNANGEQITGTAVFSSGDNSGGNTGGAFKVNCEIDIATMSAINPDKSLTQINTAFEQGKVVLLYLDVSALGAGIAILQLAVVSSESTSFMGQIYMGDVYFTCVTFLASGNVTTLMIPLETKA